MKNFNDYTEEREAQLINRIDFLEDEIADEERYGAGGHRLKELKRRLKNAQKELEENTRNKYVLFDNSENEVSDFACEELYDFLNDFEDDYIVIADLGFWDGRRNGYRALNKLSELFNLEYDYITIYIENNDLKATVSHHDGHHNLIIRRWKENITEETKEKVLSNWIRPLDYTNIRDLTIFNNCTAKIGKEIYKTSPWGVCHA